MHAQLLPPILAEGRNWLVIDKPAGLAVHPGPATPHSLEALLPGYAPGRPAPQPVHRLDRDTSGCLLLARRHSALRALSAAFAGGEVSKTYWAVVEPAPDGESGVVEAPLLKVSTKREGWRIVADAGGKPARTGWRVLQRQGVRALIEFTPETGRTHQIRVHATLLAPGSAIVGDSVYGAGGASGLMLHARALAFPEPGSTERNGAERNGAERNGAERNGAVAPVPARFVAMGFGEGGL